VALDFASAVRSVVGAALEPAGFAELASTVTRVSFVRGDAVVSLAYFCEDMPEPWVAVEAGLRGPDGLKLFGLWRVIPSACAAAQYWTWRFADRVSLEANLARIVEDVIWPFASDLWEDEERLERVLSAQADDAEQRYLVDQREADLRRARRAFDDGRFQDALDAYIQVSESALSASDRRKVLLARRQVAP
jgi:hypothetical protein